ncbi:efflux RND transporter periplasmic adaptor subunit [Viridibacterium curvum]|uniref:Efflux RND transporter periplasmic adaptor subunit n=2 Tax=Viridibacterium curvum TaxID=1101404 RepID=A0ABP9QF04_9RHOO
MPMSQDALDSLRIDRQPLKAKRRRHTGRWVALAVALIVVVTVVFAQKNKPLEVETTRVTQAWPAQGLTVLNATGYVVADAKAAVASKATGRVEWLGVREGSVVKAGEVLARLESGDLRAQRAQAVANVEVANARLKQSEAELIDADFNLKRQQDLRAQAFVAQSAVDAAENRARQARATVAAQAAAVRAAEAAVKEVEVALDNTVIRAPFAGVVLTKQADVGDVVAPFNASAESKGAVVTIADMNTLEIDADVSEASLAKARVSQPVEIRLDALPDVRLAGHVSRIVPTVDRSKATVKFKVKFDEKDARVLPDMSAKVAFLERVLKPEERTPRIAVAATALAGDTVFVIEDGIAKAREVKRGGALGDLVEITQGLKQGDIVVDKPDARLKDGARIAEKKS